MPVRAEASRTTNVSGGFYCAPEVFEGDIDFPGDVFSYSLLMYHVSTGRRAFENMTNVLGIAMKLNSGERPPLREAPPS